MSNKTELGKWELYFDAKTKDRISTTKAFVSFWKDFGQDEVVFTDRICLAGEVLEHGKYCDTDVITSELSSIKRKSRSIIHGTVRDELIAVTKKGDYFQFYSDDYHPCMEDILQ